MHIAFDLDGVLLDSESDLSWLDRALDRALRDVDLPATAENRSKLYPGNLREFDRVADDLGVEPRRLWRARNRHYTRGKVDAIESEEIRPFPDVDRLYDLAGDHRLHVVSNSPGSVVEAFVSSYGYGDLFCTLIGRGPALEDLARLKPDPDPYERLCRRAGGDVYVGDAESDREFAAATGMEYVHLDRNGGEVSDLCDAVERLREG